MRRLEIGDSKLEEEKKRRKGGLNAEFTEMGIRRSRRGIAGSVTSRVGTESHRCAELLGLGSRRKIIFRWLPGHRIPGR
jgi:hypothetical protein